MKKKFEQLSNKPSYMKHNGGLLFRSITKKKFEFKTKIKKTHLNKAGITHGGYICTIIDAGAGTACHRASGNKPCVTISLDVKFIAPSGLGDELIGTVEIIKITNCSKDDIDNFLYILMEINQDISQHGAEVPSV